MTTEPAPPPAPAPAAPPPETADAITTLPPLPNPAHPRNAGPMLGLNAAEALRVMRLLNEGATSGAVDFPYPTNLEYPLPPLPAVPVPSRAGVSRRPRPTPEKKVHPIINPPLPSSYPLSKAMSLDDAIKLHNETAPSMPASLHFGRSSMLVHLQGRGFCWALLRTLDGDSDARDVLCLSVRTFPTQDKRPPPVHAIPPTGPAHASSELLTSLKLSVPALLYRLACTGGLIDQTCFYCGKHLSDLDGLPMGSCGFLPGPSKKEEGNSAATDGPVETEAEEEGKWVCWHPKCEQ